jgi:hypothetical protein
MLALLVVVTTTVVIGSVIEIHAQSGGFRASTDSGYDAMASKLVDASNRTGGELASLMDSAPGLANRPLPYTARAVLQQGLDEAVSSTSADAVSAEALEPPAPADDAGVLLARVMSDRASATSALRSNVDRMLGMTPLPVAGAAQKSALPTPAPFISQDQAASGMSAAGLLFQRSDTEYRTFVAGLRTGHVRVRIPPSIWVPAPVSDAPLGPDRLGASAAMLAASAALVPYHQLVITTVGLVPQPVASGGAQTTIPGCSAPRSNAGGGVPTAMPPTTSVRSMVTVTNCGTVAEPVVRVTETLVPADPPGTPPPPAGAEGGTLQSQVSLRSGASAALSLGALAVASGHSYTLTFSIAIPVSQAANDPAGSSQQLLLHIAG